MNRLLITALITAACLPAVGQEARNVLDLKTSITDNAIVYPESFETDTHRLMEGWYIKNYTATDDRYATQPDVRVSDEEMVRRLQALPTVIELPYNQIVRSYIDRYTQKSRPQVAAILGLSHYYMPIFEQALEEQGLPLELKYLPVIESGLDPNAVSQHGAAGLWQFMLGTAKGLGLEVNSLVDERRDPYLASQRAASYLKDLYSAYGDWSLAIAAYNCGPGAVNKAIRRAGGEPKDQDFWSIYEYLTPETRGYVPMFIAANYVMNYYPKHNISPVLATKPLVMDTIQVAERINLNQISTVLDIPMDELRVLNPQFRADIIPGTPDNTYTLILPSQQIHAYLMSEDAIRNCTPEKYARRDVVEPGTPSESLLATEPLAAAGDNGEADVALAASQGKTSVVVHKVAAGESLGSIAQKYGVTPAEIKTANGLRRNAVRVGQQLKITTAAVAAAEPEQSSQTAAVAAVRKSTAQTAPAKKAATKAPAANPATHKLRNGDSLSSLAKKYGVSVAEIKKANGMTNDNLRAGQTIKIPPRKAAAAKTGSAKKSTAKSSSKKRRR